MFSHRVISDISGTRNYLERWSITIPLLQWTIKLHKICRADDDRCHHDHPWWFIRLILWGGYEETVGENHRPISRRPGNVSFCPINFQHRITKLYGDSSWSLVITGSRTKEWGFFTRQGFMQWRTFVDAAKSSRVLWCSDGNQRGESSATIERLKLFCATDNLRSYDLREPYVDGDATYATNGVIMVRVFGKLTNKRLEKTPPLNGVFLHQPFELTSRKPLPTIERPAGLNDRWEINLSEFFVEAWCNFCNTIEEDVTVSKATHNDAFKSIDIDGRDYQQRYIWLISQLPNARCQGIDDRLYFTFDGGDGVLMSLSTEPANG